MQSEQNDEPITPQELQYLFNILGFQSCGHFDTDKRYMAYRLYSVKLDENFNTVSVPFEYEEDAVAIKLKQSLRLFESKM